MKIRIERTRIQLGTTTTTTTRTTMKVAQEFIFQQRWRVDGRNNGQAAGTQQLSFPQFANWLVLRGLISTRAPVRSTSCDMTVAQPSEIERNKKYVCISRILHCRSVYSFVLCVNKVLRGSQDSMESQNVSLHFVTGHTPHVHCHCKFSLAVKIKHNPTNLGLENPLQFFCHYRFRLYNLPLAIIHPARQSMKC